MCIHRLIAEYRGLEFHFWALCLLYFKSITLSTGKVIYTVSHALLAHFLVWAPEVLIEVTYYRGGTH